LDSKNVMMMESKITKVDSKKVVEPKVVKVEPINNVAKDDSKRVKTGGTGERYSKHINP
jgi:hypothetical protein